MVHQQQQMQAPDIDHYSWHSFQPRFLHEFWYLTIFLCPAKKDLTIKDHQDHRGIRSISLCAFQKSSVRHACAVVQSRWTCIHRRGAWVTRLRNSWAEGGRKNSMLQRAASDAYSWWWASHVRTKQSKWLDNNLRGSSFLRTHLIHVDSAVTPGSSQSPFLSKTMLKACFMCSFSLSILMTFCYSEWEAGFSELFLFFLQAWMISCKRKQIYGIYMVCNLCRIVPRKFGFLQ